MKSGYYFNGESYTARLNGKEIGKFETGIEAWKAIGRVAFAQQAESHLKDKPPRLARPKEVLEYFRVANSTLAGWRKQEGFPQPIKKKKILLFDLEAVENWLRETSL